MNRCQSSATIATPHLAPAATWTAALLAWSGGAAVGAGALMLAARWIRFTYTPHAGVIGVPAFMDYDPQQEMFYYLAGLLVVALMGWMGRRVILNSRHPLVTGASVFVAGGLALMVVGAAGHLADHPPARMIRRLLNSPEAVGEALIGLAMIWALGLPAWRGGGGPEEPLAREPSGGSTVPAWLGWSVPVFLHLTLVANAYVPINALWTAPLLGAAGAVCLVQSARDPVRPRCGDHVVAWLELGLWAGIAVAPLAAYWMRWRRTIEASIPDPRWMLAGCLGLVVAAVAVGCWRRRLRVCSRVRPVWLLPVSVLAFICLSPGTGMTHDVFHQGEFRYPAFALNHGLMPWRDIFYVHGFGIDTLLGWMGGPLTMPRYYLDFAFYALLLGVATALAATFYLRHLGGAWWLMILALAALGGIASGPAACRYMTMWGVLLAAGRFLEAGRLRWLVAGGAVAWLGLYFSLDTGVLMVATLGTWALLRGWTGIQKGPGRPTLAGRLMPAAAVGAGCLAAALPTVGWMLQQGLAAEIWQLHAVYFQIKRHTDKIPFILDNVSMLVSPALTVAGLVAWRTIARRDDRSVLAGLICLLTLVNLLAFLRALDRSDGGHVAYASLPGWALLGCLVVWRSRQGDAGSRSGWVVLGRSALVVALLVSPAVLHPVYRLKTPSNAAGGLLPDARVMIRRGPLFFQAPFSVPFRNPEALKVMEVLGGLRETMAPDQGFYDFSNVPVIYPWLRRLAPTRFFAVYYTSSRTWQREVAAQLDRCEVDWILWWGPIEFLNAVDGLASYVRYPVLSEYILEHYRPAKRLPGESLLLRRRRSEDPTDPPSPVAHRDLWDRLTEEGSIPEVWGRAQQGVPAAPEHVLWRAQHRLAHQQKEMILELDRSADLQSARELHVSFERPPRGRCAVQWAERGGQGFLKGLHFELDAGFKGPYRIGLRSLPTWIWTGSPQKLRLRFFHPEGIGSNEVNMELRGSVHPVTTPGEPAPGPDAADS